MVQVPSSKLRAKAWRLGDAYITSIWLETKLRMGEFLPRPLCPLLTVPACVFSVNSKRGDATRLRVCGHRVCPKQAPRRCPASGVWGPPRGAVRGAAAQGRGATAAAMASHVQRLKLYPEP